MEATICPVFDTVILELYKLGGDLRIRLPNGRWYGISKKALSVVGRRGGTFSPAERSQLSADIQAAWDKGLDVPTIHDVDIGTSTIPLLRGYRIDRPIEYPFFPDNIYLTTASMF